MGSLQLATLASVDLDSPMAVTVHLASTAPELMVLYSRLAVTRTLVMAATLAETTRVHSSSLPTAASTLDMAATEAAVDSVAVLASSLLTVASTLGMAEAAVETLAGSSLMAEEVTAPEY